MNQYHEFDERAEVEKGDVQGITPFLIMCAILFIAFILLLIGD